MYHPVRACGQVDDLIPGCGEGLLSRSLGNATERFEGFKLKGVDKKSPVWVTHVTLSGFSLCTGVWFWWMLRFGGCSLQKP